MPRRRRQTVAIVLAWVALALTVPVAGPVAAAQVAQREGVDELWKQYPLDDAGEPAKSDADGRSTATRAAAEPEAPGGEEGSFPVLYLVLGLGVAGLLLAARASRGRVRRVVPSDPAGPSSPFVEGRADRDGIGAFSGYVHARADGLPSRPEPMLLVRDPRRGASIWVFESELATDETRRHAEAAGT